MNAFLTFLFARPKGNLKRTLCRDAFFPAEKPFVKTTRCAAIHMNLAVLPKHSAEAVSMLRIDRVDRLCVIWILKHIRARGET